jgi:hypothetical protein
MQPQARTPTLSARTATFAARRASKRLCESTAAIALMFGLGLAALGLLRAEMARTWHALSVCQQTTLSDFKADAT